MDTIMGIDPSINSTGICIYNGKKYIYYNIVGSMTKKMAAFTHKNLNIISYEKLKDKKTEYFEKEQQKSINIFNICKIIEGLIKKYKPACIAMEGVSYGSVGSAALVDLSGLNFAIRMMIMKYNINMVIIPPTTVKKAAVANGQADKQIMVDAWKRLDKNIADITEIKIDDLADSYFILQCANNGV